MSALDSMISEISNSVNAASAIWPQIIILIAAVLVPGVYLASKNRRITSIFAMASMAVAAIAIAMHMHNGYAGEFMGLFAFDAFSGLMMLLFLAAAFIVTLASPDYAEGTRHHGEYYALILSAAAGMMFVASASDLIAIFVGVELTSISTYALVALKKNDPRASEAAVKYLIIGGLSTGLTLYGMSLVYGITGTTDIAEIAQILSGSGFTWAYAVAFITLVAGYGFKVSAVPFHMWAPDVYEGAATPVSAFLAVGSKKMGIVVFMKIFLLMFVGAALAPTEELQYFFAILAAVTMTAGNIVAISQTSIKRMLAYSSVSQAGYLLIVFAVATEYAAAAGMFHMITHVFMKGGAFIVVAALAGTIGEKISDYRGLAKRAPFVAFAMMLFLFSLAGIPPLAGFTSKLFLFSSALNTGGAVEGQWVWLVFVAVINSAISLYYYAKVVKAMVIEKGPERSPVRISLTHAAAIAICAVCVFLLGVYPDYIMGLCEEAASALF